MAWEASVAEVRKLPVGSYIHRTSGQLGLYIILQTKTTTYVHWDRGAYDATLPLVPIHAARLPWDDTVYIVEWIPDQVTPCTS